MINAEELGKNVPTVRDAAGAVQAMEGILAEAYAWGLLGLDLEWDKCRNITWIGLGTKTRSVAFWYPTLPKAALDMAIAAVADPNLAKLSHNCQADKEIWELNIGPVGGTYEDTMLLHHAAYPGLAHDLQNVSSQFLVVPPWKTWRREEIKASKIAFKEAEKAAKKAEKQRIHEEKNAIRKAEAERKKAERQKAHEERNAAKAAEKAAKQAAKAAKKKGPGPLLDVETMRAQAQVAMSIPPPPPLPPLPPGQKTLRVVMPDNATVMTGQGQTYVVGEDE